MNDDGVYELECIRSKDDEESAGAHEDETIDAECDNESRSSSCEDDEESTGAHKATDAERDNESRASSCGEKSDG